MQIPGYERTYDVSITKIMGAVVLGTALFASATEAHAQEEAATAAPPPAAAPTTPAVVPTTPAATSTTPATCGPVGLARVAEAGRRGTVRVTTHAQWGAGFLIDDTHVVTHSYVVERPLSLSVHASDGGSSRAKVIAVDSAKRIAILELETPLPGKAIELATSVPEIGSEVVGIGVAEDFGTAKAPPFPVHRRGVITDHNDDFLATDALFGFPQWGGPLLDCEGHAIGVVAPSLAQSGAAAVATGRAIPVGKIREAQANVGRAPPPRGQWVGLGLETLFAGQAARGRGFVGGIIGFPITFAEQWEFVPRIGVYAGIEPQPPTNLPIPSTATLRLTPDLRLGYRIPLASAPWTASLVPSIGAGWNMDMTQQRSYKVTLEDPTCTMGCPFRATEFKQDSWQTTPAVFFGLTAHLSVLAVGYELRVPTVPHANVIHQFMFGVSTF